MTDGTEPDALPARDILIRLIRNERTKLRAGALNGVAIASIAAGFITPLAALAFGVPGAAARGLLPTVLAALCFLSRRPGPTCPGNAHARKAALMTGGEIFLLALGPTIALAAGLIIYGLGAYGPDYRRSVRETVEEVAQQVHGSGRKR